MKTKSSKTNILMPYFAEGVIEAGCDEAGRGCLAGPVCAAAVILPEGFSHPLLNDSKQMKAKDREELRKIIENEALAYAVTFIHPQEIDRINILQASIRAMHICLDKLSMTPEIILVDGNKFNPYKDIKHHCIVKGDSKYASIAAASVLAKTHRDEYMQGIDKEYPQYDWKTNMGYPTPAHREAIRTFGPSPYHRMTFRLLPEEDMPTLF